MNKKLCFQLSILFIFLAHVFTFLVFFGQFLPLPHTQDIALLTDDIFALSEQKKKYFVSLPIKVLHTFGLISLVVPAYFLITMW